MKNSEIADIFEEAGEVKISKLYWLAATDMDSDVEDLLQEMHEDDFKKCFPDIAADEELKDYIDEERLCDALRDYKKYGFLAEVKYPECSDFKFKKGEITNYRVSGGISRRGHVYAETTEDLRAAIVSEQKLIFNEWVEKAKKKPIK